MDDCGCGWWLGNYSLEGYFVWELSLGGINFCFVFAVAAFAFASAYAFAFAASPAFCSSSVFWRLFSW